MDPSEKVCPCLPGYVIVGTAWTHGYASIGWEGRLKAALGLGEVLPGSSSLVVVMEELIRFLVPQMMMRYLGSVWPEF